MRGELFVGIVVLLGSSKRANAQGRGEECDEPAWFVDVITLPPFGISGGIYYARSTPILCHGPRRFTTWKLEKKSSDRTRMS